MRKKKTIRLAYLKDHTIDEIVTRHIDLVTKPKTILTVKDNADFGFYGGGIRGIEETIVKEAKPAPRRAILYNKYRFLIHEIIMRCRASKSNKARLRYSCYVSVLGKVFGDMLYTLNDMNIITVTTTFTMGKSSRKITLNDWNIDFIEEGNLVIIDYLKRIDEEYRKSLDEKISSLNKPTFLKSYNQCLSKIELNNKDGAIKYIEGIKSSLKSEHSYYYYMSRIEDFDKKNLSISNIDGNGRIYHYLTNLPKSLKQFFNIRWQLDIANSHPLLFSFYLINHFNISKEIIEYLNNNIDNSIDHNKGKQLRKLLKDNNIEVQDVKELPNDVLYYIYSVMKGRFWDDFVEVFKTMERGEVKATLFREVFYSHSTTTRNRAYAKEFAKVYPNVWHFIRSMKKEAKGNLPHKMMRLESKLFANILEQCYVKGWCVVSIHDAIVVLDVEENSSLNTDELQGIMAKAYEKYGLFPTIKIDAF